MSKYEEMVKKVRLKLEPASMDTQLKNAFYGKMRNKMASSVMRGISESEDFSFDAFLGSKRVRIASLDDLFSFDRVASETLIHKSSRELWSIEQDEQGQTFIAKLFDGDGTPLKV